MELLLIRHARPQRIENAAGAADPSLTDIGVQQAEAVAGWLADEPIHAVYVSPMARALETAVPLEQRLGLPATVVDGVREYDHAASSYVPVEELKANDNTGWKAFLDDHVANDWSVFRAEVQASIEAIIADHRGQTVAIVCHGGVINAWAATTLGLAQTMFFAPEYTSINRFRASSKGHRSIVSLNETGHLKADNLARMP